MTRKPYPYNVNLMLYVQPNINPRSPLDVVLVVRSVSGRHKTIHGHERLFPAWKRTLDCEAMITPQHVPFPIMLANAFRLLMTNALMWFLRDDLVFIEEEESTLLELESMAHGWLNSEGDYHA